MRARSSLLVLLCAFPASCSMPTEPAPAGLVGDRATEREAIAATGSYEGAAFDVDGDRLTLTYVPARPTPP